MGRIWPEAMELRVLSPRDGGNAAVFVKIEEREREKREGKRILRKIIVEKCKYFRVIIFFIYFFNCIFFIIM